MTFLTYLLAVILTAEQAFDCISTNLVLSKGRGHEGNGIMAKWMGLVGQWWWTAKLPPLAATWYGVVNLGASWVRVSIPFSRTGTFWFPLLSAVLFLMAAVYAYALWNNYKVAWRQA